MVERILEENDEHYDDTGERCCCGCVVVWNYVIFFCVWQARLAGRFFLLSRFINKRCCRAQFFFVGAVHSVCFHSQLTIMKNIQEGGGAATNSFVYLC